MKKITLHLIILLFSINCFSQLFTKKKIMNNENFDKPKLSWGYYLGSNSFDYNFDYKSDLYDVQTEKKYWF